MPLRSVSEVTRYLKGLVERDRQLMDLWVGGEVANLRRPASGHSYFTLRDRYASLRSVVFKDSIGAHFLADGAAIVAHGRASLYEARGDLQLIADIIQPEGVGELEMKLQELKVKLEAEGLFEPSRKRPLPVLPQRVGVVTSPSGAVWRDMQTIVARRYPLAELVLSPAVVQGEEAPASIVSSIDALNRADAIDVVIVARGGGSLEDLLPFNGELVARAIYSARAPVISAVGHETNTTIADLVADYRAPTPSAAAEMAVPDRYELQSSLLAYEQALAAGVTGLVGKGVDSLGRLGVRLERSGPDFDGLRMRIDDLLEAAARELKHDLTGLRERLGGLAGRLEALSPQRTLRRGYAIVHAGSSTVTDAAELSVGDPVDVTLAQGGFGAEVKFTERPLDEADAEKLAPIDVGRTRVPKKAP